MQLFSPERGLNFCVLVPKREPIKVHKGSLHFYAAYMQQIATFTFLKATFTFLKQELKVPTLFASPFLRYRTFATQMCTSEPLDNNLLGYVGNA